MSSVQAAAPCLLAMTGEDVEKVHRLETQLRDLEQVSIRTDHHLHAGLYSRTIRIPAGVMITGALIRISTLLIVSGHVLVFTGGEPLELCGYHVIPGQAGRKQVFVAHADTYLTMLFATTATTVEQAEAEFTDEANLLMSRYHDGGLTVITGD